MEITIRPVTLEEVQILSDISCKTFYDTFYQQNTKEDMDLFLEQTFNPSQLLEELKNDKNYFLFAEIGTKIWGYLKLSTEWTPAELEGKTTLEISRIYVTKDQIGSGVGKALLQHAISFAEKLQKEIVFLGVWEHNHRAINFYKSFGFEKFAEHVFMVGTDPQTDWLLKKALR